MKTVSIIGARPQFVKAAVVSRALRNCGVDDVLVHTGQHYDDNMSAVFFRELQIPSPRYSLAVGSGKHGQQTGRMLALIEETLEIEQPDLVIVFGDTNSTLAGALAASKLNLKLAHVEAGLRSYNRQMPEEINRVVADHIADLLFVPTETGRQNLLREGIADAHIHLVGDVMYDAAIAALQNLPVAKATGRPRIVATFHRAENTRSVHRLASITHALQELSRTHEVLLALHPGTRAALIDAGLLETLSESVDLRDPLSYYDMLSAIRSASLVLTDSGGLQKEAYFCRVPCVTMRDETEWVELVEHGWNRLASPDSKQAILDASLAAMAGSPTASADLFGGGEASRHIAEIITSNVPID